MKKILVAAALIGTVGLVGTQIAMADGGYNYCGGYGPGARGGAATVDQEALDAYRAETAGILKDIVVKRSTLNALMRQDNPDEAKVAVITGELYDLENTMSDKAETLGVAQNGYRHGPGMMWNGGYGSGRHMMDW